jgi:hypothetical protein
MRRRRSSGIATPNAFAHLRYRTRPASARLRWKVIRNGSIDRGKASRTGPIGAAGVQNGLDRPRSGTMARSFGTLQSGRVRLHRPRPRGPPVAAGRRLIAGAASPARRTSRCRLVNLRSTNGRYLLSIRWSMRPWESVRRRTSLRRGLPGSHGPSKNSERARGELSVNVCKRKSPAGARRARPRAENRGGRLTFGPRMTALGIAPPWTKPETGVEHGRARCAHRSNELGAC